MHVDLLNGQSAELRDAETFTRGERTAMLNQIRTAGAAEDNGNPLGLASNAIFAALIESWTLPSPLPRDDQTVVDKLLAVDFDALDAGASEVMKQLLPQAKFVETADPETPTEPSND